MKRMNWLGRVVKERDELKDKIAKWEESSKNLDKILNSQMSARDKTGLGYSIQLNELSSNHETDSENSFSVFDGRSSDEKSTLGLDEYAIRNKIIESQTTELNTKTSETADSVIIEDWNSDDEEEGTARPVCTARPSISTARPSISTARPSISTARPVCTARPSISTARPVYASRPIYPRMDNVRPRGSCSPIKRSYYTKPAFRPKDLKQDVKTFRVKNMTTAGKRAVVNTGKGKLDTDLKKSRWVWRPKGNYLDHVSKDSGSFMLKKVEAHPESCVQDHRVVDSGCSSHMTGNKAYLSDYEDFQWRVLVTKPQNKTPYELLIGTQDSYVAGSSGKDKGPTQEYILLSLQPHRTRIPVKDVVQDAQEKPFENALLRQGWPRFIGCC
ncbi:hypothetical protein Tco_1387053 [Tanacetum coccineum]